MALFLVVAINDPSGTAIQAALTARFPNEHYEIAPNRWVVSSDSPTAKDLSDTVGITQAGKPATIMAIVVSIRGYYGAAPGDLWEWMAAKVEKVEKANG
jgi:hypothetical protein